MSENTNVGHRQRLRDRFIAGEESSRSDEALLELLLSYAIPQQDVQPLARKLLTEFGGLANVLRADHETPCRISGVSGRIVPLGSIQRVMRESIEAAAQYIKANSDALGVSPDWRENFDVAVLATYMGVPKEGPSAGITIVTSIVSALTGVPVRNDLAMTGEITIKGKVLPVGGVQEKVRAAHDAGVKEVLLPADNLKEAQGLPSYILNAIKLTQVQSIDDVLPKALLEAGSSGDGLP